VWITLPSDGEAAEDLPSAVAEKALSDAVEEARAVLEAAGTDYRVSADGADVPAAEKWVTQAALDALTTAQAAAKKALLEATTEAQFDAARAALETALEAFEKAKKPGAKTVMESEGGTQGGGTQPEGGTAVADDAIPQTAPDAVQVTAIRSALTKYSVVKGKSLKIPVAIDVADGETRAPSLTWSSSKPKIATVDARTGKVKGVKAGTAVITAKAANGKSKSFTVKVTAKAVKVAGVRVTATKQSAQSVKEKTAYKVVKGETVTVKTTLTGEVAWKSSSRKVATVSKTGVVKGVKPGKAKITATAGGKKKTYTVTVVAVPKSVNVSVKDPPKTLAVGKTQSLKVRASGTAPTGAKVTFKSSKPSVLTVDKAGKLTAVAPGTAKVTVKIGGKKATLTVKVT